MVYSQDRLPLRDSCVQVVWAWRVHCRHLCQSSRPMEALLAHFSVHTIPSDTQAKLITTRFYTATSHCSLLNIKAKQSAGQSIHNLSITPSQRIMSRIDQDGQLRLSVTGLPYRTRSPSTSICHPTSHPTTRRKYLAIAHTQNMVSDLTLPKGSYRTAA